MKPEVCLCLVFFDALCSGLINPVVPPLAKSLGASLIAMGFFTSATFISNEINKQIVLFSNNDLKYSFSLTFLFVGFSYTLLMFSESYEIILICRIFYVLTNQIISLSRKSISATIPDVKEREQYFITMGNLQVAGNVIGPIIGGYIFDSTSNIVYISIIASVLTHLCIYIVQFSEDPDVRKNDSEKPPESDKSPPSLVQQLKLLKHVHVGQQWENILLKIAFTISFMVYFTRGAVFLRFKYHLGPIMIGYSIAYQNILLFVEKQFLSSMRINSILNTYKTQMLHYALLFTGISLTGIFYAPTYDMFLLGVIPLTFFYLVFEKCKNPICVNVDKATISVDYGITFVVNVLMSIILGVLLQIYLLGAFKLFFVLPVMAGFYFVKNLLGKAGPIPVDNIKDKKQ